MRYLVLAALALVLLVGVSSALPSTVTSTITSTAEGGDVYQYSSNYAEVSGEGAVVTESITQTATGSNVDQEAENYAAASGEGAVLDQSITQTADATGWVDQYADNDGYAAGEAVEVTQSIDMTATAGGDVWQNYGWYYSGSDYYWDPWDWEWDLWYFYEDESFPGNYAEVYGDGATVTQSISMDATGENVYQNYGEYLDEYYLYDWDWWNGEWYLWDYYYYEGTEYWPGNEAYVIGEGTTTTQTYTQEADAEEYVYQLAWNYVDPDAASTSTQTVVQSATAGGDIDQNAANDAYFYGDGATAWQSIWSAANTDGGYVYQWAYNDLYGWDYDFDPAIDDATVGQSITLGAIASDYTYQYAYNYADVMDNAWIAQFAAIAAVSPDVTQYGYNTAYFGDAATVGQTLWFSGVSDDVGVYQYGNNYASNENLYDWYNDEYTGGDSANSIAQWISAGATGGDNSYQYLYNYVDAYYNYEPSSFTVNQLNDANLAANDNAYQYMYNGIDWWEDNTGSAAQVITGAASAGTYVYQDHENWNAFWS